MQALNLVKSYAIAVKMATMRDWKRLGKVILKHNVPVMCQCEYRSCLDSLLRCAGLGGVDAIDDISDEPNIYVPYTGDKEMFIHDTETMGQVFDRAGEILTQAVDQIMPTQDV